MFKIGDKLLFWLEDISGQYFSIEINAAEYVGKQEIL